MPQDNGAAEGWPHVGITMPYELYREMSQEAIASKMAWGEVARTAFRFYLDAQKEARTKAKESMKNE